MTNWLSAVVVLLVLPFGATRTIGSGGEDDGCDEMYVPDLIVDMVTEVVEDLGYTFDRDVTYSFCDMYGLAVEELDQVLEYVDEFVDLSAMGINEIDLYESCNTSFVDLLDQLEAIVENPFVNESWPLLQLPVSYEEVSDLVLNATAHLRTLLQTTGHCDTTFGEACPGVCVDDCRANVTSTCVCGESCTDLLGSTGTCGKYNECAQWLVPPDCSAEVDERCSDHIVDASELDSEVMDGMLDSFDVAGPQAFCQGMDKINSMINSFLPVPRTKEQRCVEQLVHVMVNMTVAVEDLSPSLYNSVRGLVGIQLDQAAAVADLENATANLETILAGTEYGTTAKVYEICPIDCGAISCPTTEAVTTTTTTTVSRSASTAPTTTTQPGSTAPTTTTVVATTTGNQAGQSPAATTSPGPCAPLLSYSDVESDIVMSVLNSTGAEDFCQAFESIVKIAAVFADASAANNCSAAFSTVADAVASGVSDMTADVYGQVAGLLGLSGISQEVAVAELLDAVAELEAHVAATAEAGSDATYADVCPEVCGCGPTSSTLSSATTTSATTTTPRLLKGSTTSRTNLTRVNGGSSPSPAYTAVIVSAVSAALLRTL